MEELTCNICGKPMKKKTIKAFGHETDIFECPTCSQQKGS